MPGKSILFQFLAWFLLSIFLFWYFADNTTFLWMAIISIGVLIGIIYFAFKEKKSLRYLPIALVAFILALYVKATFLGGIALPFTPFW